MKLPEVDSSSIHHVDRIVGQDVICLEVLRKAFRIGIGIGCKAHLVSTSMV